jgi:hypothetical protein
VQAVQTQSGRDWQQIARELNEQGCAVLKSVLTPEACAALLGLYPNESGFRSRVVTSRPGFGRREYKYFSYPLPGIVQGLRTALYRELAPVANQRNEAMGIANTKISLNLPDYAIS